VSGASWEGGGFQGGWRGRKKIACRRVLINAQIAVPLSGSCSKIKQGCAGCCPDCKQKQNCPCGRASSRHKPWSRFAFGLLFARFAWFERSFDVSQVPIECEHLRS